MDQVTPEAAEHLKASGVTVKPYEAVLDHVRAVAGAEQRLWVDPAQVPSGFLLGPAPATLHFGDSLAWSANDGLPSLLL